MSFVLVPNVIGNALFLVFCAEVFLEFVKRVQAKNIFFQDRFVYLFLLFLSEKDYKRVIVKSFRYLTYISFCSRKKNYIIID